MPSNHPTDFDVVCRKRGDTLCFHVTGNVDWQAVPIAYWQEIVAITQHRSLRKLRVPNRKKYKPASGNELVQQAPTMKVNHSIADRDAVTKPTGKFTSAVNCDGPLATACALQASIGSKLSPFKDMYFQSINIGLSLSKSVNSVTSDGRRWLLLPTAGYWLGASKVRTVQPGHRCRYQSELMETTVYSRY